MLDRGFDTSFLAAFETIHGEIKIGRKETCDGFKVYKERAKRRIPSEVYDAGVNMSTR